MEESNELEVIEEPNSPARVVGGIPYFEQYLMLAERIARTAMVPSGLRGKPEETLAVMMYGAELGIGPMQALQQINFIEGKPAISPELMRAMIRQAGHKLDITQTATECVIVGTRCDTGEAQTAEFTLADAVLAGLCSVTEGGVRARSKEGKALPWEKYTKDLLFARATSRIARGLFSDVIAGMSYTPEEVWSFTAPAEMEAEPLATEEDLDKVRTAIGMLEESDTETLKAQWKEAGIRGLDSGAMTQAQCLKVIDLIAALLNEPAHEDGDVVDAEIIGTEAAEVLERKPFDYAPESERFA